MKRRHWLAFSSIGLLLLLAGCASSGPARSIDDPGNSLVFGYIDMSDAPTSVDFAWVQQLSPPSDSPFWRMGVKNGLFRNEYLPAGSYQLSKVSGSGFFAGQHNYNFPRQDNQTSLRIATPGIYFLGSFKYKKVSTGLFEQGKFAIERTSSPSEAELLKRILDENSEVRDSAWGNRIRARLAQLKP